MHSCWPDWRWFLGLPAAGGSPGEYQAPIPKRGSCACSVAQSCLTFYDPMDCSPAGSTVQGILQARILEWVASSFSGDLLHPGIEPASLVSPEWAGGFFTTSAIWEALERGFMVTI